LAERRVVTPDLDHRRCFAPLALRDVRAPADHRSDLDLVGVLDALLAGDQGLVADDEHGLGIDAELGEDVADLPRAGHLPIAVGVPEVDPHGVRVAKRVGPYGMGTGRTPSVTDTVRLCPFASTMVTVARSPGCFARISDPRASEFVTVWPSNATMTSPALILAFSAGLWGPTASTYTPRCTGRLNWKARPGVTSW